MLFGTGVAVALGVALAVWFVGRPSQELLYGSLDPGDGMRIAAVLRETGTSFDVAGDGRAIHVRAGEAARTRMMLAERGMPQGSVGGYELFDKVGALGLTGFMQEVTRLRALEGELVRSILFVRGVVAARVHIVPADEGSFRRARQTASASIMLRMEQGDPATTAASIRRLVSGAVPGLSPDKVTVLNADGSAIAVAEDASEAVPSRQRLVERQAARDIEEQVARALAPIVASRNVRISASVRFNADRRQTDETMFNPESKVERSIRVVKENQATQGAGPANVSVERNIPREQSRASEPKGASEESQKREETTNFELSSKRTTVMSSGYAIEAISVAAIVNRKAIGEADAAGRVKELEQIIVAAGGLVPTRGDTLKVSLADFVEDEAVLPPHSDPLFSLLVARHLGSALGVMGGGLIVLLVLLLGVRPALRILATQRPVDAHIALAGPPEPALPSSASVATTAALPAHAGSDTRRQLDDLVRADEQMAAHVLQQWIARDAA